jgi:ATP-dependent protease ClpP protease subunit
MTSGGVASRRSRAVPVAADPGISALLDRAATLRNQRRPRPRAEGGWYQIRNADGSSGDTAEILLYDEIGGWWGITAQDFVDELRAVTASKIRLRINSPGGDVFDGLAIYQALLSHPARVEVQVDGLAASAASFVAQAGDEVSIGTSAMIMIHDAWGVSIGDARDMRETADLLDKISDSIAAVYAQRAGNGDTQAWRERMLAETWYTGAEAIDAGLADTVMDAGPRRKGDDDGECEDPMARKWDLSIFSRAPKAAGGVVEPIPYLVGERGPVAVHINTDINVDDMAAEVLAALRKSVADRNAEPSDEPPADSGTEPTPGTPTDPAPDDDPEADDAWAALTAGLTPTDSWASLTKGLL